MLQTKQDAELMHSLSATNANTFKQNRALSHAEVWGQQFAADAENGRVDRLAADAPCMTG